LAAGARSISLGLATGNGGRSYNGDGASGLYYWGAQLEAASFASTYIPTTTASVTRNADVLTYATTGWLNASAGTLVVTASAPGNHAMSYGVARLIGGAPTDRINFYREADQSGRAAIVSGGVTQALLAGSASTWVDGAQATLVMSWATNAGAFAIGSDTVATDTSMSVPSGLDNLGIGTGNASEAWFSPIRRVTYFPAAFPAYLVSRVAANGFERRVEP
ncbi:MAG TPA: hypothetical protein VFW03_13635, partial [Gemmatimonadaceae bacterium]|nr:hypothetical protein [Gemmatimonadaceae bacterium]